MLVLGLILFMIAYFLYNGYKKAKELKDAESLAEAQKEAEEAEKRKKIEQSSGNNTPTISNNNTPKPKSFSQIFANNGLQKKLQDANNKYRYFTTIPTTKNALYAEMQQIGLKKGDIIILD